MLISRPRPDVFLRFQNGDFFLRLAYRLHQERLKKFTQNVSFTKNKKRSPGWIFERPASRLPACSRLSDNGEDAKVKGTRKGSEAWKRKIFSSRFIFLFALSKFRWPDYLGAWNRLLVRVGTDENGGCRIRSITRGLWGMLSSFHHIFMSVFEWTGANDSKRYLHYICGRVFFENGEKNLRFQKNAEACGRRAGIQKAIGHFGSCPFPIQTLSLSTRPSHDGALLRTKSNQREKHVENIIIM